MHDAEYAQSPYQQLHRGASLILALGSLLVNVATGAGPGAMRMHAYMLFPLALIWFADQWASKAIEASGGWLRARNADVVIRLGGWLLLLLLLAGENWHFFD